MADRIILQLAQLNQPVDLGLRIGNHLTHLRQGGFVDRRRLGSLTFSAADP
jgi:hypothetical protein